MKEAEIREHAGIVEYSNPIVFDSKENFPLDIIYKDKKYVLFLTKNDKLMLQKGF